MSPIPLRLGALGAFGFVLQRSGIRWLCADGHRCRPNEVIAYCNIGLVPNGRRAQSSDPFAEEARDFQVAFAPRVGGQLRIASESSLGGFLDQQQYYRQWSPEFVIGHLECDAAAQARPEDPGALRLLLVAGRRTTELAEVRASLLTGWHDRSRAWWGEGNAAFGTLLSLGICEQLGIIRGERFAFLEMFDAAAGPAHVVHMTDDALVPSARVVLEQFRRTRAEFQAILADFACSFQAAPAVPAPADWMFAGALLSALGRTPIADRYDTLTPAGLRRSVAVDAVLLSLAAEASSVLRHKRLGYSVQCHGFRIQQAGPATRAWLASEFEPVKRTPDDVRADYRALLDAVRARADIRVLVMNRMSTSGFEDVYTYVPFDRPMGDTLGAIQAKEMNLMLHDLARERDISIVDLDLIAAGLGGALHLPDGIHASGLLQAELRAEILRILRLCGVSGFAARVA